jgi:hypothetical protein
MSYVVRVGDRGGVFRSFEERTFDLVLKRYAECMAEWPDKVLTVHNEEKYDAEWVDDRWIIDDGMTDEEKEALDGV